MLHHQPLQTRKERHDYKSAGTFPTKSHRYIDDSTTMEASIVNVPQRLEDFTSVEENNESTQLPKNHSEENDELRRLPKNTRCERCRRWNIKCGRQWPCPRCTQDNVPCAAPNRWINDRKASTIGDVSTHDRSRSNGLLLAEPPNDTKANKGAQEGISRKFSTHCSISKDTKDLRPYATFDISAIQQVSEVWYPQTQQLYDAITPPSNASFYYLHSQYASQTYQGRDLEDTRSEISFPVTTESTNEDIRLRPDFELKQRLHPDTDTNTQLQACTFNHSFPPSTDISVHFPWLQPTSMPLLYESSLTATSTESANVEKLAFPSPPRKTAEQETPAWTGTKMEARRYKRRYRRVPQACIPCRYHKQRCSGDKPTCNGCLRYSRTCGYRFIDYGRRDGAALRC